MNQVDVLKQEIENSLKELKAKKVMLAILEKQQKQNTPFSKTKVGSFYYKTLQTISSPFVNIYQNASKNLDNPFMVKSDKLLQDSIKLIEKASHLDKEKDENNALIGAVCLANQVIKIENFCEQYPEFLDTHKESIKTMRKEVERLRPQKNNTDFEKIALPIINNLTNCL